MDNNHRIFMLEALKEAWKAEDKNEVPVGAIVVYNGEIIGKGHNSRENTNDVLGHAEINAIREAQKHLGSWRLEDCILYSTLEPCIMCSAVMIQSRIKTLVYGTSDLKGGAAKSLINMFEINGLNHKVEVINGILENECKKIVQSFFKKLREK